MSGVGTLPELGPLLGRLLTPPAEPSAALANLETVRLELLGSLFQKAGAARALLAAGDESGARAAVGPAVWVELWEQAVSGAARGVAVEQERRLRDAARLSRYPAKRLAAALPDSEERRLLAGRLSAAGSGLEEAVLLLGDDSRPWPEALRRVSGELQAAWDRLTATAQHEIAKAELRAAEIRSWRRPWLPLLIAGTILLAAALWLGLVLGGYLRVPGWLTPFANWVWNL